MSVKDINRIKYENFIQKPSQKGYNFNPIRVCLYVTRACNLSCPNCTYASNEYFRKGNFLNTTQFKDILAATKDYSISYAFAGGEPLLNDEILDFTDLVRDVPGATTTINTNGLLLDKYFDRIINSNVGRIQISFDAMDDEGFQRERRGKPGSFDKLCDNVRELLRLRADNTYPFVAVSFLLHRGNFNEIEEMIAFAEKIGVDQVGFHNVNNHMDESMIPLRQNDKDVCAVLDRIMSKRYDVDILLPPLIDDGFSFCLMPFKDIYINDQLGINPCCHVMDYSFSQFTGSLEESWNSPKLEAFRQSFIDGKIPHANCVNCQRRFWPYGNYSRDSGWVGNSWKYRMARKIIKSSPIIYRAAKALQRGIHQATK